MPAPASIAIGPTAGAFLSSGASAGAGAGTAAAAGIGLLGSALFVGAGLGVLMGVLGYISANARNKELKKQAIETQKRINIEIGNVRLAAADQVRRRSALGNMAVATARNRFAEKTGLSISERLGAMVADTTVDIESVNFAEQMRLKALEIEKTNVITSARAGMTSPLVAGVGGFVSGFTGGVGLVSSAATLAQAGKQVEQLGTITALYGGLNAGRLSTLVTRGGSLEATLQGPSREYRTINEGIADLEATIGAVSQ